MASIPPTMPARITRGTLSSQRIAASRSDSPDSISIPGTLSRSSATTEPTGRSTAPTAMPSTAQPASTPRTRSAEPHPTLEMRGPRSGSAVNPGSPALRQTLDLFDDDRQVVHDTWAPTRGDVIVQFDHVAIGHSRKHIPTGPGCDGLHGLATAFGVAKEYQI